METLLSSPGNSKLNPGRMPRSNTSNLPQTLMGLTGQLLCVPSAGYTLESMTLGHTDNINALIHAEDLRDWDLLLKVSSGKVNLLSDGSTVQLDLSEESLLLPEVYISN